MALFKQRNPSATRFPLRVHGMRPAQGQPGPAGVVKGTAKSAKKKPVSLKNQIRSLERLLKKVGNFSGSRFCAALLVYAQGKEFLWCWGTVIILTLESVM